jgi:hypothetical protein
MNFRIVIEPVLNKLGKVFFPRRNGGVGLKTIASLGAFLLPCITIVIVQIVEGVES